MLQFLSSLFTQNYRLTIIIQTGALCPTGSLRDCSLTIFKEGRHVKFFPKVFLLHFCRELQPTKTIRPNTAGPKPNWNPHKTQNHKTTKPFQDPNPKVTISERKWEKCMMNKPRKKHSVRYIWLHGGMKIHNDKHTMHHTPYNDFPLAPNDAWCLTHFVFNNHSILKRWGNRYFYVK